MPCDALSDPALPDPLVRWRDGVTPVSDRFGDVYFSPEDGLAESRRVFLDGIDAPACWMGRARFTIGETGFGVGLNFLAARALWLQRAPAGARLRYVAVEGYPVSAAALRRALSCWPMLDPTPLIDAWPARQPGVHRLVLDAGRVALTLLYGEAAAVLRQMDAVVDAWFLDGFAPSRNPSMWRAEVLQEIARLSAPRAQLASFTVAGPVRRSLEAAGFEVHKAPGFGRKRHCLRAVFTGARDSAVEKTLDRPWFAPAPVLPPAAEVAVIGGGVAGLTLGGALERAGLTATLYERASTLGAGASGGLGALLAPRLRGGEDAAGRLSMAAFLHAARFYRQPAMAPYAAWPGVLECARTEDDLARLRVRADGLSPGFMQLVTTSEGADLAGAPLAGVGGLWLPQAGCLRPRALLPALASGLRIRFGVRVERLVKSGSGWLLQDGQGALLGRADAVVLACGPYVAAVRIGEAPASLPLTAKRGQTRHVAAPPGVSGLRVGLAGGGGHLTPPLEQDGAGNAVHVAGATFAPWAGPLEDDERDAAWRRLRADDDQAIIAMMAALSPALARAPALASEPGWAGLRATTADHLPVMGPLPDDAFFKAAYATLRHGPRHAARAAYPLARWRPGLFCLTGLGSHGFCLAPLLAEALVDLLTGAPPPLPRDLKEAVHPARFLVRALRRSRR